MFKGKFSPFESSRTVVDSSESFTCSYPDGSCRKFEDSEKPYFY